MSSDRWVPVIYEENRLKVLERLREGEVEYLDLSSWSYQDRFFAFLLAHRFFEICGASYPSPRKKEEVPVWFLLCCGVLMRTHATSAYSRLPGLLKNGPLLSRVKFNVGGVDGGFNRKNRAPRESAVHHDGVRKFFKDTVPQDLRRWHNHDIARFYRHSRAFDKHGVFIMDQTHVVVPDNPNYRDAVRMPVDENGQILDLSHLTEEQRKAVRYRSCYALSELMHIGRDDRCFVVAGYQWGPGDIDELAQGRQLIREFTAAVGTGVIKLLIVDKGYIDGGYIAMLKEEAKADVLLPLRSDMDMYRSAVAEVESAQWDGKWTPYRTYNNEHGTYTEEVAVLENCGIWKTCPVRLDLSIMRTTKPDGDISYWVLATTFKPKTPKEAFEYYALRTEIEERHRQYKHHWDINNFTSPYGSLVEAHVLFTLLTYSLIQLHLMKSHMSELTNKTISSLQQEESTGTNAAIVYHDKYFAVLDMDEYTLIIADLQPAAKERIKAWIRKNQQMPSTNTA
jgi:hypothetical protein